MKSLGRMDPTEKAEAIATFASVFMAAGMIGVAAISGSVAVLAEGIDTCVDIITSVAVMIGLKLSKRRSDNFPEGLYKIENIVTVAIAVLILYSAYELATESIQQLLSRQTTVSDPWVAMATMAVVVMITGLLAWNKGRVGKRENSPSLLADSRHSWTDTIASAGVILGLGLNAAGVPYVDSIMALVIAVILAWSGWQVAVDAFKVLLDASIEQDVIDEARATAEAVAGVRRVVRVDGRNSGSYRFLHMTIVPEALNLREAESCAETVKRSVRAAVRNVESVQVELVADEAGKVRIAVPLEADRSTIARDLASASWYALLVLDPGRRALDEDNLVLECPTATDDPGHAIDVAVAFGKHGADGVLLRGDPPACGPLYVLEANSIDVLSRPDLETLDQAQSSVTTLFPPY